MPNFDVLSVDNIVAILDDLADIRQMSRSFPFLARVPVTPALDEEILAYYTNRLTRASIVADDQKAPVRSANPIRLEQTKIPNLKHGRLITQAMLSILERVEAGNASRRDNNVFEDYLVSEVTNLRDGVAALMEYLVVAMLVDALSWDEGGIKISTTWAMPSDLKVTPGTPWSTAASATPVTDILTVKRIASQKYGVNLDRATMSTQALLYMVATTEFKNLAALLHFGQAVPATGLPVQNIGMMTNLAGNILGVEVEVNDLQVWAEAADGSQSAVRYLPTEKVLLTSRALDDDRGAYDFANGMVIETRPGMVDMFGAFGEAREGPTAYYTRADPQGNPPGLIGFGVGRGFPRKHVKSASAVLTVYTP